MAIQEHKAILALGAASVFILGVVVGGLATRLFFFPASPPADLPVPVLLEETHRLLDQGRLTEAEKSYQSVLSRGPGNPEAITHIGNIAFQRGDVERDCRIGLATSFIPAVALLGHSGDRQNIKSV